MAQDVQLDLTDDSFVRGTRPTTVFGGRDFIQVHRWGPMHGLLRFNIYPLVGQTITRATLTLQLQSLRSAGSISVHTITSAWNEGSVTWDTRPNFEPLVAGVIPVAPADVGNTVEVDVTDLVERWADGSLYDDGVLLMTEGYVEARFDSKKTPSGTPARLDVEIEGQSSESRGTIMDVDTEI